MAPMARMALTTKGVLYMPGPLPPSLQVQPPLPMSFPKPFPVVFSFPPAPQPRVVSEAAAGAASPPQMPAGMIYPPATWPAFGPQREIVLRWDQRNQGQQEGSVMPHFVVNPSRHDWSQGDGVKQQPQEAMLELPSAPGTLYEAEETQAPGV
ncbi:hypothetical protein VULLAG_LOCUS17060 [Vulpes lagopus]